MKSAETDEMIAESPERASLEKRSSPGVFPSLPAEPQDKNYWGTRAKCRKLSSLNSCLNDHSWTWPVAGLRVCSLAVDVCHETVGNHVHRICSRRGNKPTPPPQCFAVVQYQCKMVRGRPDRHDAFSERPLLAALSGCSASSHFVGAVGSQPWEAAGLDLHRACGFGRGSEGKRRSQRSVHVYSSRTACRTGLVGAWDVLLMARWYRPLVRCWTLEPAGLPLLRGKRVEHGHGAGSVLLDAPVYDPVAISPSGTSLSRTPLIVPIRGHLDSIKRPLASDVVLSTLVWTLSDAPLVCHCTPNQDCHADSLIALFRSRFPHAYDRGDLSTGPPSSETLLYLATFRDGDAHPKSTGWYGMGEPMMVGTGHTAWEFCDGQTLASQGRWPVEMRRYASNTAWTSITEKFMTNPDLYGPPRLLSDLALGKVSSSPFSPESIAALKFDVVSASEFQFPNEWSETFSRPMMP